MLCILVSFSYSIRTTKISGSQQAKLPITKIHSGGVFSNETIHNFAIPNAPSQRRFDDFAG